MIKKAMMLLFILFISCKKVNEPIIPSILQEPENEPITPSILQEPEKEGYVNISAAESMLKIEDTIKVDLISYFNPIKFNLPRYNGNLNKLMLSKQLEKLANGDYTYHSGVYEVWFQQTISDCIQDKLEILPNPIILLINNVTAYLVDLPTNDTVITCIYFTAESENDVEYYNIHKN